VAVTREMPDQLSCPLERVDWGIWVMAHVSCHLRDFGPRKKRA
jgi:hypothetical protein